MVSEIELEIGPGAEPSQFVTRVVRAAAGGQPTAVMQLDVEQLLRDRDRLENVVLASAVKARRVVPVGEQYMREIGQLLFSSLFVGPVYGAYRASLGAAQQEGERLRVVLHLTAPQLAALPWEALFDKETGKYICRTEPLVRHVPAPFTPDALDVVAPIRVLGLVASPKGMPALDVPAEQARLRDALARPIQQHLIELEWMADASWEAVHERLLSEAWHVLHFVGHGDYDVVNDQGLITLVGPDGRADPVEAERLADLFSEAQPAPRLVVLNSCSGGESAAQDLFSGTAAALVRSGISAVAAMQFAVSDDAAIAFARGFYTAIAAGRGVDQATRSGRIGILGAAHSLEWVTPVLYVRGNTTRLFDITAAPTPDPAALEEMYAAATSHLRAEQYGEAVACLEQLLTLHPHYRDGDELRSRGLQRLREAEGRLDRIRELQEQLHEHVDAEEWEAAVQVNAELASIDPSAADPGGIATAAKAALDAAREQEHRRDRIRRLQDQVRAHAAANRWDEVLRVDAQLTSVDPAAADPDGLSSRARAALEQRARRDELDERYGEALARESRNDLAGAVTAFDAVLQVDPAFADAAVRRETCLRRQRQRRARLGAVGAVGVAIVILVLARPVVVDVVIASRGLGRESMANLIWLFPCAPLLVAAWLLLVRKKTGFALGGIAAAWLWVAIAWGLALPVADDSKVAVLAVEVLLLLLLACALAAATAAEGARRPTLNDRTATLRASPLVAAAVLLRLLNVHLADIVLPADGPPPLAAGTPEFWIAVLVPLAIGGPAVMFRFADVHATALRTLVALQIIFEVMVRVPGLVDGKLARGDVSGTVFLLGTVCLLLAVVVGQRRRERGVGDRDAARRPRAALRAHRGTAPHSGSPRDPRPGPS